MVERSSFRLLPTTPLARAFSKLCRYPQIRSFSLAPPHPHIFSLEIARCIGEDSPKLAFVMHWLDFAVA